MGGAKSSHKLIASRDNEMETESAGLSRWVLRACVVSLGFMLEFRKSLKGRSNPAHLIDEDSNSSWAGKRGRQHSQQTSRDVSIEMAVASKSSIFCLTVMSNFFVLCNCPSLSPSLPFSLPPLFLSPSLPPPSLCLSLFPQVTDSDSEDNLETDTPKRRKVCNMHKHVLLFFDQLFPFLTLSSSLSPSPPPFLPLLPPFSLSSPLSPSPFPPFSSPSQEKRERLRPFGRCLRKWRPLDARNSNSYHRRAVAMTTRRF